MLGRDCGPPDKKTHTASLCNFRINREELNINVSCNKQREKSAREKNSMFVSPELVCGAIDYRQTKDQLIKYSYPYDGHNSRLFIIKGW